jgi:electron transfer flavoprotein alpha subunit
MTQLKGILILGETAEGKLTTTTKELLGAGRKLGDAMGQPISLLLAGENLGAAAEEGARLGAGKVHAVKGSSSAVSHPDICTDIVTEACRKLDPSVILFGQTDLGRDVAPRLGARLGAALSLDCVALEFDAAAGSMLQTRPVYGGRALSTWASPAGMPLVATLRPRAAAQAVPDESMKGEIAPLEVAFDETLARARLVRTVKEEAPGVKLEEARIIVSGGGGIGGPEGFKLLEELAHALGGAVGSTRVPVDEGWVPKVMEIGQTGRIVSPDLYIAVGISGAPQHIFRSADFGVVADYRQALPPFIEKLKALLRE